jgi:hypothetical protein
MLLKVMGANECAVRLLDNLTAPRVAVIVDELGTLGPYQIVCILAINCGTSSLVKAKLYGCPICIHRSNNGAMRDKIAVRVQRAA